MHALVQNDIVALDTPDVTAVARRVGRGEWLIHYPTGSERFHGSRADVRTRMLRRIAADYPPVDLDRDADAALALREAYRRSNADDPDFAERERAHHDACRALLARYGALAARRAYARAVGRAGLPA